MEIVKRNNLIPGREYYIQCLTYDEDNNIVVNVAIDKLIGKFVSIDQEGFAQFRYFRTIKEDLQSGYPVGLGNFWNFYEVKKDRIQQDMEYRALQNIMREITGDEYFIP
jgi:hypothetical protein